MKISRKRARELGIDVPPTKPVSEFFHKGPKSPSTKVNGVAIFDALCESHGLPLPDHEYNQWCPGRKFSFDYLFDGWLAVEKDGGTFGMGEPCPTCGRRKVAGHGSIERQKSDREKLNLAALYGYVVLRFTPQEFDDGSAFVFIKKVLFAAEET